MAKKVNKLPSNPEYKWWEDPYLWSEDDGDDMDISDLPKLTKEEIEEIFRPINHKSN